MISDKLYKKLEAYDLIILDMDGTLYFQRGMQLRMAMDLLMNALFSKNGIRELRMVLAYRKEREAWDESLTLNEETLLERAAGKARVDRERAGEIIRKWLFVRPLDAVRRCRDDVLIDTVEELLRNGKRVCIYSDYETCDKAEYLGLTEDIPQYWCGKDGIQTMKPNPSGLFHILAQYPEVLPARCLVVGDRGDRDGEAARAAGVDCLILKRFRFMRRLSY